MQKKIGLLLVMVLTCSIFSPMPKTLASGDITIRVYNVNNAPLPGPGTITVKVYDFSTMDLVGSFNAHVNGGEAYKDIIISGLTSGKYYEFDVYFSNDDNTLEKPELWVWKYYTKIQTGETYTITRDMPYIQDSSTFSDINVNTGEQFTISVTVSNPSITTMEMEACVKIAKTPSTTITSQCSEKKYVQAHGSETFTITLNAPSTSGDYYLWVGIKSPNYPGEGYYTDQSPWKKTLHVREPPSPSLKITSFNISSGTYHYGDTITGTITIKNTGNVQLKAYPVIVFKNGDYKVQAYVDGNSKYILPSQEYTWSFSWTPSKGDPTGYYTAISYAYDVSNPDNNNLLDTLTKYDSIYIAPETLELTIKVHNIKGLNLPGAGGTLEVELFSSSGTEIESKNVAFSGEEAYKTVSFTDINPGSYFIRVYQTPPDGIKEYWGKEDLGYVSDSTTFDFYRNMLYLRSVIIEPTNPKVGDTVTIKAEIANPNDQDLKGGIASIYIDRDKQSPYDFSQSIVYDIIPAGSSKIITLGSFNVTEIATYYVKCEIATQTDIGTVITDHNMNWQNLFTVSNELPDLTVTSVKLYKHGQEVSNVYPGDQVEIIVTVKNNGDDSSPTYIGLYLSKDEYGHSSSNYIDKIYISGLSRGKTETVSKTITIPTKSPGNYYLTAFVDYNNQVAESNENNNIGYTTININPEPVSIDSVAINYYDENSYHKMPVFKVKVYLQGDTSQIKKVTLWWDDKNDINPFPESIDFTRINEYYYEGILNLTGHEGHDIGYHIEVELANGSKLVFPKGWSGGSDDAYIHLWSPIELSNIQVILSPDRKSREFITGETINIIISLRNRLNVPISKNLDDSLNLGLVHIATKQELVLEATPISLNSNEEKNITLSVTIPSDEWMDVAGQHHPVLPGLYAFGAILVVRDLEVGNSIRFQRNLISGVGTGAVFTGNSTVAHYYPPTVLVLSTQDSLVMINKPGVSYIEQIDDIAFHLHLDKHAGVYAVDSALEVANILNTAMEFVDAVKTTGELIDSLTDPNDQKLLADVIELASNDFVQGIISGKLSPDEKIGDETSYDMTIVKGGLLGSKGALLFHDTTPVEVTKAGWERAQEFFWDATVGAAIAVLSRDPLSAVKPYGKEILDESASYLAIYSKLEEAQITYAQYRSEYFKYPIYDVDTFKTEGGDYIGYIYGIQFQNKTYRIGDKFVLTFKGTTNGFTQNLNECQGSCPSASSFGLSADIYLENSSGNRVLIYHQPTWPDASQSTCTLRIPIGGTKTVNISTDVPSGISSGYYTIIIKITEGYYTNQLGIPYEDQMFIGVKTKTLKSSIKIYIDAPPTVSFISPQPSQHIAQGDTLQIDVNATDAEGIRYVELYLDGELIKNWTSGPYTFSLNTSSLPVGQHTLKAVAVDTAGQKNETSVTFYVDQPSVDNPPTIQITNKAQLTSKTFVMGETILVEVRAGDDRGITKIEYLVNGQAIGNHTFNGETTVSDGKLIPQSALTVGENIIVAKVYDTSGQTGEDQVIINIKENAPPKIVIISPTNGSSFTKGDPIYLKFNVSDDSSLSKIEITLDGNPIYENNNPSNPYVGNLYLSTSTWSVGSHTIKVTAYDNQEASSSNQITIYVYQTNISAPTIKVISPLNRSKIIRGEKILLKFNVSSSTKLSKIEIWLDKPGETLIDSISSINTNEYSYQQLINTTTWKRGWHKLIIIVTDSSGQETSISLHINIEPCLADYTNISNAFDTVYILFKNYQSMDYAVSVPYLTQTMYGIAPKFRFAGEFISQLNSLTDKDIILAIGGPLVNAVTKHYENNAYVHMDLNNLPYNITIVTPHKNITWRVPQKWWNVSEGYFIIQMLNDPNTSALVITIYGTDMDSTAAGAYYFSHYIYPDLDKYIGIGYLVGLWEDTQPGADYELPGRNQGDTSGFSSGDTITIVDRG